MDVVRVFNNELSSLYEVKPPISKAKMTQITKSAIKGIKFYKHIVQSVEKFIQKCRPEYKVPGLYVVDSIVRQSRHQFGAEKDVFGPRFVKNITTTFQHLFKCSEDDKPKIIRVLNLWQKNNVFPIDVIQPLLDMGHPNASNEWTIEAPADVVKESPAVKNKDESRHKTSESWKGWPQSGEEPVQDTKTYAEMSTKNLEKFNKAKLSNALKEEEASRSSMFKNQMKMDKTPEETVKFNKKLLDFDYGDEDEEEEIKNEENHLSAKPNALALSISQNLLSNPELLRQIQMAASTLQQSETIQSHQQKTDDIEGSYAQEKQNNSQHSLIPPTPYQPALTHNMHLSKSETDTDDRVLPEPPVPSRDLDERSLASVMASHDRLLPTMCLPAFQQTGLASKPPVPDKDDRILSDPTMPTQDLDERSLASLMSQPERAAMQPLPYAENPGLLQFQFDKNGIPYQAPPPVPMMEPMNMEAAYQTMMPQEHQMMQKSQGDEDERVMYSMPGEPPLPPQDFDERQILLPAEDRSRKERSRSRSRSRERGRGRSRRSRSRSPRRKRSRSRSHSRKNRSRSRERERIREKERERERERERRRKGIPPIKKGCVSVCSTTLWLGHVPKACSEIDISDTFGPFGTILSIDMIPPRGCAYVVMDRRQDANKALQKLKNVKLQGSNIKMAWAPGKGVKGKEYKDYWEVDLGVSYVPYDKIKEDPEVLDMLEEGGFIDEDSLPDHLKALRKQPEEKHSIAANNNTVPETSTSYNDVQAAPNMVPPPIMPPTSMGIPMVLPHLMQPQLGFHLPGMLPPQGMVMQVPMGIPPPSPMLMVPQHSQGILGSQPLPVVGGIPQMVPRTLSQATAGLPTLKNSIQTESVLSTSTVPPVTTAGDATPTEEDGTNVSSPNVQMSVPGSVSGPPVPTSSSQAVSSQFNPVLGLNANRPVLSVPPPVSTSGTPIPYPPPNMGFGFPPPGMRPLGQAQGMPPNPQFPWMQKQVSSPFTDADSSQSTTPVRPVPPPQPGMPVHMFGNRPPFHDPQSAVSAVNSSPMKEPNKGREKSDQKPSDMEVMSNKNVSPGHHDKMIQEMVISTDDESSMDIEYPPDMNSGPLYPGMPDFHRSPLSVQRMRGPLGPMPHGPRFRGMPMGSPFPMRMGGPRGMGGPPHGPHHDFPINHGPRGPRMHMGPHGPHRNDMHGPPRDGRDWYPRDFEGPYDRDRRYRDDWNREPWEHEGDRRISRELEDNRRDNHREPWNRDRSDNSRSSRNDSTVNEKNKFPSRPRDKQNDKVSKSLMDDLLKIRGRNRGDPSFDKPSRNEQSFKNNKNDNNEVKKSEPLLEKPANDRETGDEQKSKKEKDREARKRSRWGRTLSEEREIQEQRRNEVELKFQVYAKQSSVTSSDISAQNSEEMTNKEQPAENKLDIPELGTSVSPNNTVNTSLHNEVQMPFDEKALNETIQNEQPPLQKENEMADQTTSELNLSSSCEVSSGVCTDTPLDKPSDSNRSVENRNEVTVTENSTSSYENVSDFNLNTDVSNSTPNVISDLSNTVGDTPDIMSDTSNLKSDTLNTVSESADSEKAKDTSIVTHES